MYEYPKPTPYDTRAERKHMDREDSIQLILAGALSTGDTNVALDTEATIRASIVSTRLPTGTIKPNQAAFEELGFIFEDEDAWTKTSKVTLPPGWTIEPDGAYKDIYDEKGVHRAQTFYFGAVYDLSSELELV